jgi:Mg2+/Co2+ transporter CorC
MRCPSSRARFRWQTWRCATSWCRARRWTSWTSPTARSKSSRWVLAAAHSRFPAVGEGKDDVLGILLAKDLLRYFAGKEFDLRDMLRPAIFIP